MISFLKRLFARLSRVYYRVTKREPWYKYYDGVREHLNYPNISLYKLLKKQLRRIHHIMLMNIMERKLRIKSLLKK